MRSRRWLNHVRRQQITKLIGELLTERLRVVYERPRLCVFPLVVQQDSKPTAGHWVIWLAREDLAPLCFSLAPVSDHLRAECEPGPDLCQIGIALKRRAARRGGLMRERRAMQNSAEDFVWRHTR